MARPAGRNGPEEVAEVAPRARRPWTAVEEGLEARGSHRRNAAASARSRALALQPTRTPLFDCWTLSFFGTERSTRAQALVKVKLSHSSSDYLYQLEALLTKDLRPKN